MIDKDHILQLIKSSVKASDPDATLILYGSYARGDYHKDSDIDLLVLIDTDRVTWEDRKRIGYPLYDIELNSGILISTIIHSKKTWRHPSLVTPFYENVTKEGIVL